MKIQDLLIVEKSGTSVLADAVGKHRITVEKWLRQGRIPAAHDRYLVALACGCSEQEALLLAKESPSKLAKETA